MSWASQHLEGAGVIARVPRLTPRKRRATPWLGSVVALDTEGTGETGTFTASAQWDDADSGIVYRRRFRDPHKFAQFLIERSQYRHPTLMYFHNLEWDLQVLWQWLTSTPLHYSKHMARRNGSALSAEWDYDARHAHHRKVVLRDSFAIWPLSLAQLGRSIGLPKYRTPRELIPNVVNWRTGEMIPSPPLDDDDAPICEHGKIECMECYDLRDVAILHAAMRLYVTECNDAGVSPALTRSAHAMRDFRTNYLDVPLMQYTEKQNLRAQCARYGGRSQMLSRGLTVAPDGDVIVQADIVSEYPSIMARGKFPDAAHHWVWHNPRASRVHDVIGWGWAEVTVPDVQLGALIYRDPRDGRISYPATGSFHGAWTTDELAYALDLGYAIKVNRLEGTPSHMALDPFAEFIADKWRDRATYKRSGDAREAAVKLTMNGLSGKFGMRWTDPITAFRAPGDGELTPAEYVADAPCVRDDIEPMRYPDYLMVPWSALIMARGRIMLHRFGIELLSRGAELLCCDTDSWTFRAAIAQLDPALFGTSLGEWKLEDDRYVAFRGAAPKEYALYADTRELFAHEPIKCRAKGIGGSLGGERARAIDHYLRTGNVHYQRPNKTRSVIRGARGATFVTVEKSRHTPCVTLPPMLYSDWRVEIARQIREAHAGTLWLRHHPTQQGVA